MVLAGWTGVTLIPAPLVAVLGTGESDAGDAVAVEKGAVTVGVVAVPPESARITANVMAKASMPTAPMATMNSLLKSRFMIAVLPLT